MDRDDGGQEVGMRISFVVYGLLYIVVELIGARLEEIGWPRLTALDVATAVVHAILTVAIAVAVLVALDIGGRHWRRSMHAWHQERARLAAEAEQAPVTVHAWRLQPAALPAGPSSAPFTGPDYATATGGGPGGDGSLPLYVPSEILDRNGRRL
jgi:hypothetical protein